MASLVSAISRGNCRPAATASSATCARTSPRPAPGGEIVLISGEAGAGKTALATALASGAIGMDALCLAGHRYDGGATPP